MLQSLSSMGEYRAVVAWIQQERGQGKRGKGESGVSSWGVVGVA